MREGLLDRNVRDAKDRTSQPSAQMSYLNLLYSGAINKQTKKKCPVFTLSAPFWPQSVFFLTVFTKRCSGHQCPSKVTRLRDRGIAVGGTLATKRFFLSSVYFANGVEISM